MSNPQQMSALATANRVRLYRAGVKREVSEDSITVLGILEKPHPDLYGLPILELLRCQRRWGIVRSKKFLWRLGISETKKIGQLTPRQVKILRGALR